MLGYREIVKLGSTKNDMGNSYREYIIMNFISVGVHLNID